MVEFAKLTPDEMDAAEKIARRFLKIIPGRTVLDITMDLSAVHAHTPLDLAALAKADEFNLLHDVGGIARHLDRTTGELTDCFLPRYTRRVYQGA